MENQKKDAHVGLMEQLKGTFHGREITTGPSERKRSMSKNLEKRANLLNRVFTKNKKVKFDRKMIEMMKDEEMINILSFLSEYEIFFRVGLASKRLNTIVNHRIMWKSLVLRRLNRTLSNRLFKKLDVIEKIVDPEEQRVQWRKLFLEICMSFEESSILTLQQMKVLNRFFGSENESWKLIYRASRDGWKAQDFHKKCDYKANTMTVIRSTNHCIFGGFTPIRWNSNETLAGDGRTFIFSLVNAHGDEPVKMENNGPFCNNNNSIWCSEDYGPCFGEMDIVLYDQPHLRDDNFTHLGYAFKLKGYKLGEERTKKYLTGDYTFTPKEIEVFQKY